MTRAERLDRAAARAKVKLDVQRQALAQIQAAQYAEEKKALTRRRQLVGQMADQAGLLAWDDSTLTALFATLATLRDVPNPVAVLEACLSDAERPALASVDGMADASHRAAPGGAVGDVVR